ncbi:hypothetical protein [Glaesserella sp.]|uniref:hypothetical protein n=1 Tax=Glaesserella sp. TaxID=2094731 RepID=UPI00359F6440
MKLLDIIENNTFIDKLYPYDINTFFIPKINISTFNAGHTTFFFHIKEKPAIKINKKGDWGNDYSVVVLELSANLNELNITNIRNFKYEKIHIEFKDNILLLTQEGDNFSFNCKIDGKFYFQGLSTYME